MTATNTFGAAGLLSRRVSSTSTFYQFDPQGSVVQRLNSSGTPQTNYCPDAWGVGTSSGGAATDPWVFGAQWGYFTDRETGLLLCTHRFYDPGTGRFLNRDPVGSDGGVNLYGYVGSNPVGFVDPSGLLRVDASPAPSVERAPAPVRSVGLGDLARVTVYGIVINFGIEALDELSRYRFGGKPTGIFTQMGDNLGAALFPLQEEVPTPQPAEGGGGARKGGNGAGPRGGTYILVDPDTGEVVRTGQTNDLDRRRGEHARDPALKRFRFQVDKRTDDYTARRRREQILWERFPNARCNKQRGIDPRNPRYGEYMKAGREL